MDPPSAMRSSMMKKAKSGRKKRSVTCKRITSPYPRHLCRTIAEKSLPLLSTWPFSTNVPHILLNSSSTYSNIQLEKLAPNALRSEDGDCLLPSAPIKLIVSEESLRILDRALDVRSQNRRKSSRCHREIRLWLDKEKRLFPGPNHPSQKHQKQPIYLPVCRSLELSTKDTVLTSHLLWQKSLLHWVQ
jgi:hypothetical protein